MTSQKFHRVPYKEYTVYLHSSPRILLFHFQVKFWIEGVLLLIVGSLGFLGNLLTLAVLAREESFTQIIKTARLDTVFNDNWDSVTILAKPKIWFQS